MPKGPYDDWDDLTPGKSSRPSSQPAFEDWEDITPEKDTSFGSGYALPSLGDLGRGAAKAAVGWGDTVIGGLDVLQAPARKAASLVGLELPSVSGALEDLVGYDPKMTRNYISSFDSDELKQARAEQADSGGFVDTVKTNWRNPGLAILSAEESAPQMLGGGALGRVALGARPAIGAIRAGMFGEAAVTAGSQSAQIREDNGDFEFKDLAPTIGSAALTSLISGAGGKLAKGVGLPDVDAFLADRNITGSRRIPALLAAGLIEAGEEGLQSANEQAATNYATGKPLTQGVGSAVAEGAIGGGLMGGTMPAFRRGAPSPVIPPPNQVESTTDPAFNLRPLRTPVEPMPTVQEGLPFDEEVQGELPFGGYRGQSGKFTTTGPGWRGPERPTGMPAGQPSLDLGIDTDLNTPDYNQPALKFFEDQVIPPTQPTGPTPADNGAVEEDEVPLKDIESVPEAEVTNEFRDTMRDMGYEIIATVKGNVIFRKIMSEKGSTPIFTGGKGPEPGETTGRVASMPVSSEQAVSDILANTQDEATVDARANDLQMRVAKITNPQELAGILHTIQMHPQQDAITRGLADIVARRLNEVAPGMNYGMSDPIQGEILPPEAPTNTGIENLRPTNSLQQLGPQGYEKAKADLVARYNAGQVVDYEEELAALSEAYGVQDTMSVEMGNYVDEAMRANREGYKVYPPGSRIDGPVARTFQSEGKTYSVVGYDHLVSPENPTGQYTPNNGNRLTEGDTPSMQSARPKGYVDPNPEVPKRYEVYDENDNLIDKTYDSDEAQRWADENNGYVKDTQQGNDNLPRFAKVTGGGLKVDADIRRTAINITKDYTTALSGIMAREGLQNTLDAADKMPAGEVKVRVTNKGARNGPNSTIEMHDNGPGMNEDMLAEKLVRLFASGKENEAGATGGKGIGSASYILGGQHFEVDTIAKDGDKKYRIIASGTPEQFMSEAGSDYSKTEVPMDTPTGTAIKVVLKDDQDPYYSTNMVKNIIAHSRNRKSRIVFDSNNYSDGVPISELEPDVDGIITANRMSSISNDKIIGDFSFKDSNIKVAIPKFDPNVERDYNEVHYLNNGMYQFSETKYLNQKVKGLPEHVIVNIEPQMDEQDDNYPFINTREDVKKDMREFIEKYIEKNISGPAVEKKENRTQELYDSMSTISVPGTVRKPMIYDPGERLTKTELKSIIRSAFTQEYLRHMNEVTEDVLVAIGRDNWYDKLEGVGLIFSDDVNGIHIPNARDKKSATLYSPWPRMNQGMSPADNAWHHTITLLHEVAHIGEERGYEVKIDWKEQDLTDPRIGNLVAVYMQQVRDHGDVSYQNTGHGMDFAQRLGEVISKFGVERTYAAADQLEHIFTGGDPAGGYSPEIQRILQLHNESRGRDETTEDLLSPTGVKQANNESNGEGPVSDDNPPVGTGTPARSAVDRFRDGLPAVNDYKQTRFILPDGVRVGFKDWNSYHSENAREVGVPLYEALENGIVRFAGDAAEVASPITAAQAVHLADSIAMQRHGYLIMDVVAPSGKRVHKSFGEGTKAGHIRGWVNTQFKKLLTDEVGGIYWNKTKQATGWGSGGAVVQNKNQTNWVKEALAVPGGLTTTADVSAPFRQGIGMIHTPQFWKAVPKMFMGMTEAGFQAIDRELRNKPIMQGRRSLTTGKVKPSIAQEAGLKMFESASTAPMSNRAQATASRWIEQGIGNGIGSKIWRNTAGKPIRASNRAYITFLNHLKVNRFEYLMDQSAKMHQDVRNTGYARPGVFKQAFTQQEGEQLNGYRNKIVAREIADFVNTATGQGPLKTHILPFKQTEVSLERASGALQHILFSPGLIASRVRMLNPSTYIMASPQVRKQYMKSALATAGAWAAVLALVKGGGGDEVEVNTENMTSADWMKAKIGDTRLDPGGGFQQFLVALARMKEGGKTSSASGEWQEFGEGYNAETQWSNLERFASNKLNPVTKFAYDLLRQSEYNPFHVGDRVAQLFVPLVIQDLVGIVKEDPNMLPWMVPIMLGMGTQTYGRGESVSKLVPSEYDWLATGGGVDSMVTDEEQDF